MAFPKTLCQKSTKLELINICNINKLEELTFEFPYKIFCLLDEKIEKQEPTIFLVVYVSSKTNYILMVDQSNQVNSIINLDGDAAINGYYEVIDVGVIERFPLAFYVGA